MSRLFLALTGFFGATSVIFGSLSSHAFKNVLNEQQIEIFKIGVQYQMYHTLALLAVGIWLNYQKNRLLIVTGWLFILGIIFFSGTMYSITYLELPNIGTAPIGGFAFILGWLLLIVVALQRK